MKFSLLRLEDGVKKYVLSLFMTKIVFFSSFKWTGFYLINIKLLKILFCTGLCNVMTFI